MVHSILTKALNSEVYVTWLSQETDVFVKYVVEKVYFLGENKCGQTFARLQTDQIGLFIKHELPNSSAELDIKCK